MIFLSTAQFVANSLGGTATRWIAPEVDAEFTLAAEGIARQQRRAIRDVLTLKIARVWFLRRRETQRLHRAVVRLSEVSPHLLQDIGIDTPAEPPVPSAPRPAAAPARMPATVVFAA